MSLDDACISVESGDIVNHASDLFFKICLKSVLALVCIIYPYKYLIAIIELTFIWFLSKAQSTVNGKQHEL